MCACICVYFIGLIFLSFQIRKTAADQFYITLVTYDDIIDAEVADEVIGILSETAWSVSRKKAKIVSLIYCNNILYLLHIIGMVKLIQCGSNEM